MTTDAHGEEPTGLADPTDERSNCGVGVVADLECGASHDVVADGLALLSNLEHRGTTGAEPNTGDGAGIMLQRPDAFFDAVVPVDLPTAYAVGVVFLPNAPEDRDALQGLVDEELAARDLDVVHWRDVPTENADLGRTALDSEPHVAQCFVVPDETDDFDRALYVARRAIENRVKDEHPSGHDRFYVCSLDTDVVVYKGLLTAEQLPAYFPDLRDDRVHSQFVLVHARFSTNTLGAWHLAHPYRRMIHNGEINTIRGNKNWMRARETDLESATFGAELDTLKPVVATESQSDTATVDNVLELLLQDGRDLPHALRMLVPEAWRNDDAMSSERRNWYDFHASLVEPWDGPALIAATDGERVGAILDRNGLRPCRYDVTTNGRLVMASEVGALDTDPADLRERGRLEPGQSFLADPIEGRIIPDDEVFEHLTDDRYGEWIDAEQRSLSSSLRHDLYPRDEVDSLVAQQATFGYTEDERAELIEPMARHGKDPVGSMGDDTPLSVLSAFNRPLFTYFKQLFAQVTNPPIDYIRESLVTSLETRLGNQRNLLTESLDHARHLVLDSPVLTDAETRSIAGLDGSLSSTTVDITFPLDSDLESAMDRISEQVTTAVDDGAEIVMLSDRGTAPDAIPVPSLLAVAGVHHHLVRNGRRNRVGLVVESGDPRQVHHVAALVGYGADAVNPYLAYQSVTDIADATDETTVDDALSRYRDALEDGLLKTMAKMGISTVESYKGAQIFEAVGLDGAFIAEYFSGTENRTSGIGIDVIESDLRARHAVGFGSDPNLERHGEFAYRSTGIHHAWNPQSVSMLQRAVRSGSYAEYRDYASAVNDQQDVHSLRGLLRFADADPIPIEDVEPVTEIVMRFSTAPMSLGSLSPEAHENNAIAMNRLGGKSNTGEGGEPPERFGTERSCNVKQVASGRFGVTIDYLADADELQIKMAQGSKPGEGGHLPGKKVNEMIAHVRHSTPGVGLISPPPLHDIYSIEDLKELIYDLSVANPDADVNVKLVSEAGIGTIAAGVAKAKADVVHISGHAGGTGASPRTSIKNAGLPWELGLAEANQLLCATGLRDRIRVSVDGGLKTGRDVAIAALLGAEEYVFGTASLVVSGCVMARVCHTNNCPVGVATQKGELRERFPGEPQNVINYMTFVAQELREIMADLGVATVDDLVGRVDLLEQRDDVDHPKARELDLSAVLAPPLGDGRRRVVAQDRNLDAHLDHALIERSAPAFESQEPVIIEAAVSNADRAVGAMLSNRVVTAFGPSGLPDDTISVEFEGTAGQSFGAFLASGVTLSLDGAANDYVGKGLSGGKIVSTTPLSAGFNPAENIVVGNVALYGATDGECYVEGRAGERFAVRNSGVKAVVEGVGDHGCEYMTGGVVAVLGATGKNFAAGMSGGVAYVYDEDGTQAARTNLEMVTLDDDLDGRDRRMLKRLLENHAAYTGSAKANAILEDWDAAQSSFVKVMPNAYQRVIDEDGRADVRDNPPISPPGAYDVGEPQASD